ncbi:MAG: helix-turn-helix domain-containing protein [Lewinella sp.]|nr:helix-turn-helix domain-containing protein [Lewinella sp.]
MLSEAEVIKLLFGFKLKYLRQESGLGLEDLAARTGLSKSYIHDIEKGKKYPKVDKIHTLATGLGVEYDFLVSRRVSKKMQPVVDLLTSDFFKEFPLDTFGIHTDKLMELLVTAPDKVNAFISTIIGVARHYQLEREHLYFTALRAYQDLHDNYFPDLEAAARACRTALSLPVQRKLTVAALENALREHYGITVDRRALGGLSELKGSRSYYSTSRRILYLAPGLTPARERFLLAREIAFQHQGWEKRPYLTRIIEVPDFETLHNNFRASYLASALLMEEEQLLRDLREWAATTAWDDQHLRRWLYDYQVTPEMLLQRLTNLLPAHFGINDLFFIRLQADEGLRRYQMTKELHLARQHNPYANALNEHYCRRWVSVNIIKQARQRQSLVQEPTILTEAQISSYYDTPNAYFCLSMAVCDPGSPQALNSVTLGLLVNDHLRSTFRFLADPQLPVRTVNTTCERCAIPDCEARVTPPRGLEQGRKIARMQAQLKTLDEA